MKTITFHCEVITPMFLAGADGKTPELRPPSIKGAMRFWWRAMNGHLVTKNKDGSWDYSELKKQEAELFGGTEQKAKFSINTKITTNWNFDNKLPFEGAPATRNGKPITINIFEYLTFGLKDNFKDPNREYIGPNSKFDIIITANEKYHNIIKEIMSVISYYGGFGAKTHNGFGSFSIKNETDLYLQNYDYIQGTKKAYYTFSKNTLIYETKNEYTSWEKTLGLIGSIYKNTRGSLEKHYSYNKRKFVASPIITKQGEMSDIERHSKFLFLKVHKHDAKYYGQILLLPYLYLTDSEYYSQNTLKDYNKVFDSFSKKLNENQDLN